MSLPEGQPKLTVLTASYNSLEGLRRTVASVSSQMYANYEHVVVDGGSSDGTADWLARNGDRINWISEPDDGIADALNKGLDMASGEWILVLHADDTFADRHSLEQVAPFLKTATDIVSCDVLFETPDRSRLIRSRGFSPWINFKTTIPHQGAFCRDSLVSRIGTFDTSLRVVLDYEFFLRAHRSKATVDVVHIALSRMPGTGVSSRRDWPSLHARFEEERAVHRMHCPNLAMWMIYRCYWPLYMTYRWIRSRLRGLSGSPSVAPNDS